MPQAIRVRGVSSTVRGDATVRGSIVNTIKTFSETGDMSETLLMTANFTGAVTGTAGFRRRRRRKGTKTYGN